MEEKKNILKGSFRFKKACLCIIMTVWNMVWSLIGILSWILKTSIALLVIGLVCGCIAAGLIFIKVKPELDTCMNTAYDKISTVNEADFMKAMDTYIYDKDKNLIGIVSAGNFEYVDIDKISMNIQNAYISQEDKRFKEHCGVDFISTARAGLALVKNKGKITQGGSTITQQVIKNTYLTQEKSFKRKIIEMIMAPQLELKFSKSKIMEFYCNTNYYGNRCYGVQSASQYYFGKDASDVSIAEAAMLVGLSNSPSTYDPVKNYDKALEKRNSVIQNLYKNGYITEEEKEDALHEALTIVQKEGPEGFETYQSTYAVHCAALTLMKKEHFKFQYTFHNKEEYDSYMNKYNQIYGEKIDEIRSGGYHIYTSLDSEIQEKLQESIDITLAGFEELQEDGRFAMQGAAAIADNRSGYIVAIVGGRGRDDQYNRAYLSARQPGSSIKPLIDYTPALDSGAYFPSKIMNDHEIEDGPKNSGGGYRGDMSLREAVNRSINTIAWQVLQDIGVNHGLDYLGEMKFHKLSYIDNDVAALAIGGFTNGTRVVDMVKGYQTLANYGEYNDNTCIIDIKNSEEISLIEPAIIEKKQVYERDSAYLMTDILKGTINTSYGTGRGLDLNNGMPCGGKTGTTNNNKDTWFCGYTRYYTTAVWVGYDTPREMPGIYGATYAGKVWKTVMDTIHDGLEFWDWERPETVYESYYDPATGEQTEIETGLTDLFSRSAEIKAKELEKEQQAEALLKKIEEQVEIYENSLISGPEDTYAIEDNFKAINNVISKIEDVSKREELYNRIYDKYKSLLAIRDEMSDEISLYERQKLEAKSLAAAEAERQAEEDRRNFIRETREREAERLIGNLEAMEYQTDSDELLMEASEALEALREYDAYDKFYKRLNDAIERINYLPTYEEYLREKERKESMEAEKEMIRGPIENDSFGPGSSQNPHNIIITEEYGPGMETDQTNGPGME